MKTMSRALELSFGLVGSITGFFTALLIMVGVGSTQAYATDEEVLILMGVVIMGTIISIVGIVFTSLVKIIPQTSSIVSITIAIYYIIYHYFLWFSAAFLLAAGIIGLVRTLKYNKKDTVNV